MGEDPEFIVADGVDDRFGNLGRIHTVRQQFARAVLERLFSRRGGMCFGRGRIPVAGTLDDSSVENRVVQFGVGPTALGASENCV